MKVQVLLTVAVLILTCTACAGAAAAVPITPTPVPIPTPAGTPDPLWVGTCVELGENLDVCLLPPDKIKTTLLTGPVVVAKLIWIASEDSQDSEDKVWPYIIRVDGVQKDRIGYESFVLDSEKDLARFDRVFIYIKIGDRKWEFGFPVEECAQVPQ